MKPKSGILTTYEVPQYIRRIVRRLSPELIDIENYYGYTFRLTAKWKCGYEEQLKNDCEKLIEWCKSWHAHAEVIKYNMWYNEIEPHNTFRGSSVHKQQALRKNFVNNVLIIISDPVALRFEKDNFYK